MQIEIRRALQADWAKMIALHRRAAVHERRLTGIDADDSDIADAQHRFRGELRVAVDGPGQRLLGFVSWTGTEVAWLYVEPAAFRRGIGTMLMQHALDEIGFVAHIRVLVGNMPMLGLCLSQGFAPVDEPEQDGVSGPPSIRLRRVAGIIAEPIPAPGGSTVRQPLPKIGRASAE
jgi:GNAT superfamily N-acetyltransferase